MCQSTARQPCTFGLSAAAGSEHVHTWPPKNCQSSDWESFCHCPRENWVRIQSSRQVRACLDTIEASLLYTIRDISSNRESRLGSVSLRDENHLSEPPVCKRLLHIIPPICLPARASLVVEVEDYRSLGRCVGLASLMD